MPSDLNNFPPKPDAAGINTPITVEGNTYLHELCLKNAPFSLIREAITLGAEPNVMNKKGLSPLGQAIINDNQEMIQYLIDLGTKIYFSDGRGKSFHALATAITFSRGDALALLLKNGGGRYVNQPGAYPAEKEALPCLSYAVRENRAELIEPLAAAGAFLNEECGKDNMNPLQRAAIQNNPELVENLVRQGAEIDQPQSVTGWTPLHYALSTTDRYQAVLRLLQWGADPNALTPSGVSPLMISASLGSVSGTTLLLEHGADVNLKSSSGKQETALHRAATRGVFDVVAALLKAGADPLLTDSASLTAARYARTAGKWTIAEKLEEAEKAAEQVFFDNAYDKIKRRNKPGNKGPV